MTKLLESAVQRARDLPKRGQDRLAQLILDEIEAASAWDERFKRTRTPLAKFARQVLGRDARGESVKKGWDDL